MVGEIVAGLITSALSAMAMLLWRHRVRMLAPARQVRVSFCALLRIRDDDRYVLFHAINRPGSYGPPGGVYKYDRDGEAHLESLGFQDEPKPAGRLADMRHDLRGFINSRSTRAFLRWFDSGAGRESATECLRRELAEELAEVNHPELIPEVATLEFTPVRVIRQSPHPEPGSDHLHLRRFEIYDIAVSDNPAATHFKHRLLQLAEDPTSPLILAASARDIEYGRHQTKLIGGHTAYLLGTKPSHPPIPAVR
jgi:hypothetical protein